jgi:hypothetical protein
MLTKPTAIFIQGYVQSNYKQIFVEIFEESVHVVTISCDVMISVQVDPHRVSKISGRFQSFRLNDAILAYV